MPPLITVLMPVYNGERFLREAIESILCQTFTDFEFLIIDDGSSDSSVTIIRSYDDPRVRLVSNDMNYGLVNTLNKGLTLARGVYIARMDVDDVSLPERLGRQVEFLLAHQDVGVVGTVFQCIDDAGQRQTIIRHPMEHGAILWSLFFLCPLGHPTVMMRRALVHAAAGYRPDMREAEDYELWVRLRTRTRFANLPEVLLLYRQHSASKSSQGVGEVSLATAQVAHALIVETLGADIPLELVCRLQGFRFQSFGQLGKAAHLMYQLWRTFEMRQPLTRSERRFVRANAFRRWLGLIRRAMLAMITPRWTTTV